jgi:hypothetical protein
VKVQLRKATPGDTLSHFMGAGATEYSWYRRVDLSATGPAVSADDIMTWDRATGWSAVIRVENPEADGSLTRTVGHAEVMAAARTIADPARRPKYVTAACVMSCKDLFRDLYMVDFDAATADEVLQVALYGEVVFG